MAIDSMLYALTIPSGTTLTKNVPIPMTLIRGPSVVRDGYGTAIMKRTFCVSNPSPGLAHVSIKNQSWIDEMCSIVPNMTVTGLANNSSAIQRCGDVELQPNSAFEVNFIPEQTVTTTVDSDVYVLIDIDYPKVNAVANPKMETGTPMSIMVNETITTTAIGSGVTPVWSTFNVDIFKAGFRYLLAEAGLRCPATGASIAFFSISGASGQEGLERIIPSNAGTVTSLRYDIDYSTPLVKGPMNINIMVQSTSSVSEEAILEFDFIRR